MKLNYKRTILVGFAFFLISAFWQAYDATIPVILTNKFGMSQFWSGVIMALDNILAVFMLPLFGAISDKCASKHGKRTPFITIGTVIAAVAILGLAFIDNVQLKNISAVKEFDSVTTLEVIYDTQKGTELQTPDGDLFILSEEASEIKTISKEEFCSIQATVVDEKTGEKETNQDYTNYVVPARQAYAARMTTANPNTLILFMAVLLVVLVAMATFRSPAVALMPDVTVKPLRSKANAIINLMGTAGGILVLVLGMVFATSAAKNQLMTYYAYYGVVAGIGWATINVNSFPMVVEMCSGADIGKYTGFYYTASMSAQIVTPMLSGFFMGLKGVGMTVLFPYAAIFAGLAFVTMALVRHGDAKPAPKAGLEALDIDD